MGKPPARVFDLRSCATGIQYKHSKAWKMTPQWKCCAGISTAMLCANFARPEYCDGARHLLRIVNPDTETVETSS
jgi:hypothetical protein